LILAVVLLIRLPFLNQAVQGDDDTYIAEAEHALIEPLHPAHTTYVFQGQEFDVRGHPHPPLNAWILAGLLTIFGDVKEVPFHTAYLLFSVIVAAAMGSLARQFSPRPVWATLLLLAVPAFVVNGNSFESDLPFLAFWMAAIALFVAHRLWWAAAAIALAAMAAYQAIFLTPILAVYLWLYRRSDRASWMLLAVPPLVIAGWQLFERMTTGALPAAVLTGYFSAFGLQAFVVKLRNAAALLMQTGLLVFPILLPGTILLVWRKRSDKDVKFLLAWALLFLAGALTVFFAGAARYLLPMAAPAALLASRLPVRWLAVGFAAQMILALGMATVSYQHWDSVRRFAEDLRPRSADHRTWVNGELGLRYYLERDGALPLRRDQRLRPGDIVATSELTRAVDLHTPVSTLAQMDIRPAIPLRLIGVESHSGFSTVSRGLWPFGISRGTIDRLAADLVMETKPTLEYVALTAPSAGEQIVGGIYPDRWTGPLATVVVKNPDAPKPLVATFTIPPAARARQVTLLLDGREVASERYPGPGVYTIKSPATRAVSITTTVEIRVDQTVTVPPDIRALGIVLAGVGFAE
jgi:hypothetical protein